MTTFPPSCGHLLFLVLILGGFVSRATGAAAASAEPAGASYRVEWSAKRAADSAPLRSASVVVRAGQSVNVRTDSTQPREDQPAFPNFAAALSRVRGGNGVYELYIRVGLSEVNRTGKGKLKKKKRNISALIPIRAGETQQITSSSDLIRMDVHLERQ